MMVTTCLIIHNSIDEKTTKHLLVKLFERDRRPHRVEGQNSGSGGAADDRWVQQPPDAYPEPIPGIIRICKDESRLTLSTEDIYKLLLLSCTPQPNRRAEGVYASVRARAMLQIISGFVPGDVIAVAHRFYAELYSRTDTFLPEDSDERTLIVRMLGKLAALLLRLNHQRAYDLWCLYVNHPWALVRRKGAANLRFWQSDSVVYDMLSGFARGADEEAAAELGGPFYHFFREANHPAIVPSLTSLLGTKVDGPGLRRVLKLKGATVADV